MYSIILVEDHPIFSVGVQSILKESDKFEVVKVYKSGHEALMGIKLLRPDFAIIDLNLPDLPGESIIRDIFLNNLETKVIVLSRQKYVPQISHLLKMNIKGYVNKDSAGRDLLKALDSAILDKVYISPRIKEIMRKMGYEIPNEIHRNLGDSLTDREIEIVRMLIKGHDSNEIAHKLSISLPTVRVHTKNILKKLELDSLKDLAKISEKLF